MKVPRLHWIASLFLLLIFLGSKSMEYHTATHLEEDNIECEWCDFALLLQATPFEPAPEASQEFVLRHIESRQVNFVYSFVFVSRELDFRNFSRPPPSLL